MENIIPPLELRESTESTMVDHRWRGLYRFHGEDHVEADGDDDDDFDDMWSSLIMPSGIHSS